jgi:hypothetical protein
MRNISRGHYGRGAAQYAIEPRITNNGAFNINANPLPISHIRLKLLKWLGEPMKERLAVGKENRVVLRIH